MWNPPALTAAEEGQEEGQDEDSVTSKPSGADDGGLSRGANSFGDDTMFSPFNSMGFAHFPRHDNQEDRRSYPPECKNENNRLCLDLNRLTDSKTDANLIDVKSDMSEFNRESEMPCTEVSMRELCHAIDGNNSAAGYPIKAHGAQAKNRTSRSRMSPSGRGTSVLPLVDNFGVTGNNNDINIVPHPYGSSQNVDGNFLTLGIGGGTEIRSNSNFSTREITSNLEDTVFSPYNSSIVGQSPDNPFFSTGTAPGMQTMAGGLSSSALAGRMPTRDEGGLYGDTSSRLNSIQFPGFQTPQANTQSSFSARYDTSVYDLTPSSLPSGSTLIPQPQRVTLNTLGPQITRSTSFASQSISRQSQYCRRSSINASPESSRDYLSDRHRGSSISHAQLGNLTSQVEGTSTEGANIGPFPSSVQPIGHLGTSHNVGSVEAFGNSLFPERFGFQIPRVSTVQPAAAGPFPRRLGVQPNHPTARTTRGTPPVHLAAPVNRIRPSVPSGQHQHGMSAQSSTAFPRVDYSSGQVIPAARFDARPQGHPFVSHPYLKRQATENYPTALSGQRRKIVPQPVVIHHSAPHQRQRSPATPAHIPATVLMNLLSQLDISVTCARGISRLQPKAQFSSLLIDRLLRFYLVAIHFMTIACKESLLKNLRKVLLAFLAPSVRICENDPKTHKMTLKSTQWLQKLLVKD
ncbi:hypothetical protein DH2020_018801 [Rehmannia glutinosa]|uniref:Uncharacterized protein n=1 Tax=Rehmannia glutinosa TaxID=99300 RepID=A0ABR0WP07_REHGL